MSTLIFRVRLDSEPSHDDDLLRMQVTRAIVALVTGQEVPGGLRTGGSGPREIYYSTHADRIPREWMNAAESLTRQRLIHGYDWHGEIEEPKHDGNLGDRYSVAFDYSTIEIKDQGAEYVGLSAKQALSLLAWLEQEREKLEQLAKEQQ